MQNVLTKKEVAFYQPLDEKFIDDVIKVANLRFGEDYLNKEKLFWLMDNKDCIFYVALDEQKKFLGYSFFYGEDLNSISKDFKISIKELERISGSREDACHVWSIAITEEAEGKGIGDGLFRRCIEEALELGYNTFWCAAWSFNGVVPAQRILKRNDFEFFKTVGNVWFDDKSYRCIVCKGPCRCDADIYYKLYY